jgi:ubiquinone/menaquinone biosynthesis C-methylase UbiE
VGTGPARLLIELNRRAPELDLVGVDISPAMVTRAQANLAKHRLTGRIEVFVSEAGRYPFPDASFDIAVSTGSIHHWKQPGAELAEMFRVLKPGGRALIYDMVQDPPRDTYRQAAKRFGRLNMGLLWLHSFQEPFLPLARMRNLAQGTPFRQGPETFIGAFFRSTLEKAG